MNQKDFFNSTQTGNSNHNFILFSKKVPFDWRLFPQAFFPIIGLMARDSNFHIQSCAYIENNLSIDCTYRGKPGHLYMRSNYGPDHCLVIASVQFIHRRAGNMSALFDILKQIRRAYSTGPIIIESVLSAEMVSWCRKNGFVTTPEIPANYMWPSPKRQ